MCIFHKVDTMRIQNAMNVRVVVLALCFWFSIQAIFAQKSHFLPIKKNYKWGVIDEKGKIILAPKYDFIGSFDPYQYAEVSLQNKVGLMDSTGRIVIPCLYEQIRPLNRRYIAILEGKYWGLVDSVQRKIADASYENIEIFNENYFQIRQNGLWGILDSKGTEIIKPQFEAIKSYQNVYFLVQKNKKWGLADKRGKLLVNPDYEKIIPLPNGSFLVQQIKNERKFWSVQNTNGRLTLAFEWEEANILGNRFVRLRKYSVRRSDRPVFALYSLAKDSLITWAEYDNFKALGENWIITEQGERKGLINADGKKILSNEYSAFTEIGYGILAFRKELRWGLLNEKGTKLSNTIYDLVYNFPENYPLTKVVQNSQIGLLHSSGQIFALPIYDSIAVYQRSAKAYKRGIVTIYEFDERGILQDSMTYRNFKSIKINRFLEEEIAFRGIERNPNFGNQTTDSLLNLRGNWRRTGRKWYFAGLGGRPVETDYFRTSVAYETLRYHSELPFAFVWYKKRPEEKGLGLLIDNETGQVREKIDLFDVDMGDFTFRSVARATFDRIGRLNGEVEKSTKMGVGAYAFLKKNGEVLATFQIEENKVKSYRRISFIGDYSEGLVRVNLGGRISNTMLLQSLISKSQRDSVYALRSNAAFYVGTDSVLHCTSGTWGFANEEGKMVIEAKYDFVRDFHMGRAIVQLNQKWGVIDQNGELLVPVEYDFIDYLPNSNFQYFLLVKDGTKYGYLNREGQTLIETNYDEIGNFSENKLRVRIGNQWGFLDKTGEWVIRPQFLKAQDFKENRAAVAIIPHKLGLNKRWGFIDEKGEWKISPEYLSAGNFAAGKAWVRKGFRVGFVDHEGEYLIQADFHGATDFEHGHSVAKWEARYGLINENGTWLIKPKYLQIADFEASTGLANAKKRNSKIGLIDSLGNKKSKFDYALISAENEGLRLVKLNRRSPSRRKYGFIDSTGKEIIKPIFSKAASFSEGLARVKLKHGGKWGYIDHSGNFVIEPSFEHAYDFYNGLAVVSKTFRGEKKLIDQKGNEVLKSANFVFRDGFSEGKAMVYRRGDQTGFNYVDTLGNFLCAQSYEQITRFQNGRAFVRKDNKWAMINEKGALLTSFRFDGIKNMENDLAKVSVATLYGIADLNGVFILPVEYEKIHLVAQNLFGIEKGDRIGYLSAKGDWVWQLTK